MRAFLFFSLSAAAVVAVPDESWGYVDVRPGAHSFWWLYGANVTDPATRPSQPLILWLQGGPGASSTGYGNFAEMGAFGSLPSDPAPLLTHRPLPHQVLSTGT